MFYEIFLINFICFYKINQSYENRSKKIISPAQTSSTASFISENTNETKKNETKVTYSSANSDAVLNCPCCMALICMDCQRYNFE